MLAQAVVLVVAWLWYVPATRDDVVVLRALTVTNAWMIAFNLFPVAPLDGSKAWRAIPIWWRGRSRETKQRREALVVREIERRNRLDSREVPEEARAMADELLRRARGE